MAWNSAETRNSIRQEICLCIWGLTLTICSNSPVAVVVGSVEEALGLLVCQEASTRTKPLEEKSVGKDESK